MTDLAHHDTNGAGHQVQTDPEPFVWPLFSVVLLSGILGAAVALAACGCLS